MRDGVVRALLAEANLKVSVVVVTEAAREARRRHGLAPTSASLLAQGLAGGLLLASLQKGDSRVNLQLECDGPFHGFFVDAGANGEVRGYVKNAHLDVELAEGEFRWRAALGNSGFLSVLRDIGAEYYRSSVELQAMDLAVDLHHYFTASDQVPTRLALEVRKDAGEPLGAVAGVLVQTLPDGDREALEAQGATLRGRLVAALQALPEVTPAALFEALFPGVPALLETPVAFRCTCSHQRAVETIASLGADDVQHLVDTLGSTAVTCHFCGTRHEMSLLDLFGILERLGRPQSRN